MECPFKVGERVFVTENYGDFNIRTIKRITKTMIIVGYKNYEERFRYDGRKVGADVWNHKYIQKLTPELEIKVELRNLTREALTLKSKIQVPKTKEDIEMFIEIIKQYVPVNFSLLFNHRCDVEGVQDKASGEKSLGIDD